MDKTQSFFDPYNFNNITANTNANPVMYYEQQYVYYRYLTQVLEYRLKMLEYEAAMNAKK